MNKSIIAVILLLFSFNSIAYEIEFSGFATFSGGLTSDSNEHYNGYDNTIDFSQNSLLALQTSAEIGEGWGVTAQLISRGENNWDVDAEWAFISFDSSNDWRFTFGKQRVPFYLYSDYLDVSYAYHWIRPPSGVYSLPFDSVDGIGALKHFTIGEYDSSIQFMVGRQEGELESQGLSGSSEFSDAFNIAWVLNNDWLTFRINYARSQFTFDSEGLNELTNLWRSANFVNVANNIEVNDDVGSFFGLGFKIDHENFLLVSEYTEVDPEDGLFAPNDSYYVSFGYRINNGMFHLTYGADNNDPNFAILNDVPQNINASLDGLINTTQSLLTATIEDSSYFTLGYKWELESPVVLKLELTSFNDKTLFNDDANLLEFAVTTVF